MNKRLFISLTILIILCFAFASESFANSVTVSLQIYEIKVLLNNNSYGSYLVNGQKYSESKSFFLKTGDSISITAEPSSKLTYLNNISCKTDNIVIIGSNSVSIGDVKSNAEIEFEFKKISSNKKDDTFKCDGGVNCPIKHFEDANYNEWYHEDLDYVVKKGLMNGVSLNKFEPHESTTRAMVVTILYRLENKPKVKSKNIFDDVEENTWYTDAIIWANSQGIVLGYGDDTFAPDQPITREEMVTVLYRYNEYKKYSTHTNSPQKIKAFSDYGDVSTWAFKAMKWACGEGIINGSDGLILPQDNTERCQIAAILHRFIEKY